MYEVNERVAHVALILNINGQIKEVILIRLLSIKRLEKHGLRVLVRNVLNHNGCSRILLLDYHV